MVNHPTRLKTGDSPQPFFNLSPVATCRRSHLSPDGGGFLAPRSTAWQRMATLGSGWLHLAADGYDSTHLVDFVVL